jgi:thiosulfate/3-mercaptopyruvate sulfurtransferase
MDFKIAKNPKESTNRPYKIVPVRHIPISRDTYSSWGISDLPNYDSEPTWKYATPHNIQKTTAQTTYENWCGENCHNSDYYLTLEDLLPEEIEANKNIVLTKQ